MTRSHNKCHLKYELSIDSISTARELGVTSVPSKILSICQNSTRHSTGQKTKVIQRNYKELAVQQGYMHDNYCAGS